MKVGKLIDILSKLHPEAEVVISCNGEEISIKPENCILQKNEVYFNGEFIKDEEWTAKLIIDV